MDALRTLEAIKLVLAQYDCDYGTEAAHSRLMEIYDIVDEWSD